MANIYTDIKMFDAESYLANNPDLGEAGYTVENVAEHYVQYGAAEGRAPNAWFDIDFYREQNADLAEVPAGELLLHFAKYGAAEGRNPNPAFGEGQTIAANLFLDYALANKDLQEAFGIAADATRLTDEQQATVANHFFTYGINEDREGGIADVSTNETDAVLKALNAYQATLTAQAAADKAEQDVAAKAAAAKLVDEAGEGEDYDIEEVTNKIANALADDGELNTAVRDTSILKADGDAILVGDLAINEKNIQFVKDSQADALAKAEATVAKLKAENPAVVTLQEKLVAYKAVATEINKTVIDTEAAFEKFDLDNGTTGTTLGFAPADPSAEPATHATYSVDVTVKSDTLTLTFDAKGKLVVKAKAKDEDDNDILVDASAEQVAALNALKGVDALKAALTAAQGNIAAQAAAEKAIKDALVTALKAEGFKAYEKEEEEDEDGETTTLKSISWNDAIKDGKLAAGVELHTAVKKVGDNVVADADAKGYKTIDTAKAELYKVQNISDTGLDIGKIDLAQEAVLGSSFKTEAGEVGKGSEIGVAAAQSKKAVKDVADIKDAMKAFDEVVAKYNEAAELQKELDAATKAVEAADKAVAEAEKAFADLDINLVKADEDGAASGDAYNEDDAEQFADLFVFSSGLKTVDNFDGDDLFFFGDAAVALIVADKANLAAGKQLGGEADVLEIFAVQNGANTELYVEKEAFAGNSSNLVDENNKDFVKIELVGVNAEDLQFDGGFLTLA